MIQLIDFECLLQLCC